MILCVGTTPAAQRVMIFSRLQVDTVNRAVTTLEGPAGKSINVAKVLQALGERPLATGFLGGDRGDQLRALLTERGIEQDFITVTSRTRLCVTAIDQANRTQTELVEESRPVESADYERLMGTIQRRAPGCSAIVMSGTLTPGGPATFYRDVTCTAHELGALSIVDAQGPPLLEALAARPALVKPNRTELAATVGRELTDASAVLAAAQVLIERGAQRVVVTAGREPILACDGRHGWRITPPPIRALNPIGSGDAFTAGMTARLVRGDDLGEACRWGCASGTANALTWMAGEVEAQDVDRLLRDVRVHPIEDSRAAAGRSRRRRGGHGSGLG